MAHSRERHIHDLFQKLMGFSPIIGLFGHRQVGKTTFLAAHITDYRTLDDVDALDQAHSKPKLFVQPQGTGPVAIDECQLEPKLFPTLKEWIRTRKKPGQFILSGSVRFTSKLAFRESLAGRIGLVEMLPFSVAELAGNPLPDILVSLLYQKSFTQDSLRVLNNQVLQKKFHKFFDMYLLNGGLPGLCFIRNEQLQKNALSDLHALILGRDLNLISDTRTPVAALRRLLSHIAKLGFTPYSSAEVRRQLGLSPQTQKKLIDSLEALFLIRRIHFTQGKKECLLLEDQLEERFYAGHGMNPLQHLETAVYRNVRTQFFYRLGNSASFETYLTRDHARVPIVIRDGDMLLGLMIHESSSPSLSQERSAASFLKNHANGKIIYLSNEILPPRVLNERILACGISAIL